MINDQPPIPPLRQLCDERCAGGLAVTACYTTKWDVIATSAKADPLVWHEDVIKQADRNKLGSKKNLLKFFISTPAKLLCN